MPYLPPPPENLEPGLACTLVFYPQADEYRAALLGQLAELSDVWNWEADRATQAIIRQVWLDAEHATLECWNMACLDEILALLTEIRDRECCADTTDLIDPIPIDGIGQIWIIDVGGDAVPVPDNDTSEGAGEYPITPATDPDEGGTVSHADWTAYLCGASNYVIDSLIDWLRFTRAAINLGWAATSIISWIGARIASALLPGVLDDFYVWESDTVAETLGDIIPQIQSTQIDLAIENLDNARDALACAFVGQNTATNAINALLALLSNYVTDAAVLGLLTSPVALLASLIWNGAIDTDWDTGCDCEQVPGTISGYRFEVTKFWNNGGTTGATNLFLRDVYVNDPLYLRTLPTSNIVVGQAAQVQDGSHTVVLGNLAARNAIVADQESDITPRTTLDTVCRAQIDFVQGTSSTQPSNDIDISGWQLFDDDQDIWRSAVVSKVSGHAGWTVSNNVLSFNLAPVPNVSYTVVVDITYG